MFKVINYGKMPTRATKYSACVDLYANADVVINAGDTEIIPLGVCVDMDFVMKVIIEQGYEACINYWLSSKYLQLEPRSSLRAKGLQAGTGIIDLDFKDEICLILSNPTKPYTIHSNHGNRTYVKGCDNFKIAKGEKIAQIMLCEHKSFLMGIESSDERLGGIGSTNYK